MAKSRGTAGNWNFITDFIDGSMDYLTLNSTNAAASIAYDAPSSTVFSYNDNNTNTTVVYCFEAKQGFSKFGSYIGNGDDNGTFVFCGFKPALVMIRAMDRAEGTFCYDNGRNPTNDDTSYIMGVNDNQRHFADTNTRFDFLSNGFKLRDNGPARNNSGTKYGFMAWARNPFVTSTGIPTLAR